MKTKTPLLLAAAISGLYAGAASAHAASVFTDSAVVQGDKDSCKSKESCKGKESCKSKESCKGKEKKPEAMSVIAGDKEKESCKGKESCKSKESCKGKEGCSAKK